MERTISGARLAKTNTAAALHESTQAAVHNMASKLAETQNSTLAKPRG
jgi:hypothetical protein